MKLLKFKVTQYKSIKDSGYCWLASDLTTLAGKNESGKSAILEALRDFDTDVKSIPDGAMPLDDSGEPIIELCFKPDKAELDEVASESGVTLEKEVRDFISKEGLTISKDHEGSYYLGDEVSDLIDKKKNDANQKHIKAIKASIEKLKKYEQFSDLADPSFEGGVEKIQIAISGYAGQATAQAAAITDEATKQKTTEIIQSLTSESTALQKDDPSEKILDKVSEYIPNFIFFSDFLDILPFELTFLEAKNHKTVQDFAKVSGLNLDAVIQTTDTQRRRNLLSNHSATISGDFMDYWGQNRLELIAEPDGEKLRLGVKESDRTILFKTEQRSKGFQWFLSFYLRLNAQKDGTNIILIDEPGLYLHAKAQRDVMKVLEQVAEESQVLFSTHSPYLIDAERLDRVRLILKDGNGTHIENKIHKGADTETLTPIITAIGLDLTHDFSIAGKHNVLLEGISDYYFLQALKVYLPKSKVNDANLIPCVGAQKIPQLISLLIGWDLDHLAVLDNDGEGKRIAKELTEQLAMEKSKIIFISDQEGSSIEDLFTHDDFNSFVLGDSKNGDPAMSNSKFLKSQKFDKVLLSKKFFEKVRSDKSSIKLSETTVNAFKEIFERISTGFGG